MIHHVYACQSNVGDWLSALAIQRLLEPARVVEHLCDDPFVPGTIAQLEDLRESDLIVIGGGGLLMDYFAPFWEAFTPIAARVPFVLWGIGYCDLKGEHTRVSPDHVRPIVAAARLAQFRDALTVRAFPSEDVRSPVPCPAVTVLQPAPKERFLLHAVNYAAFGGPAYERVHEMTVEFAASTGRNYHEINNQIPDGDRHALDVVVGAYRAADIVVASRLHGCIIGLATGAKVLAVSGDWKVESFMEQAGLSSWVCGPQDLDRLPGLLNAIEGQPSAQGFVEQAQAANRAFAAEVRALASSLDRDTQGVAG